MSTHHTSPLSLILVAVTGLTSGLSAGIVNSNNPAPGDAFTNPGSSNQGQAIAGSPWVYNNTRGKGSVGIDNTRPQSGNGSVHFITTDATSKADAELLGGAFLFTGNYYPVTALGNLRDLTSLSYDWYRDSTSTVSPALHPAIRLIVDADGNLATTSDRGNLIFERAYNGSSTLTNTWITDDVYNFNSLGAGANLWSSGGLSYPAADYQITLNEWMIGTDDFRGALGTANAVVLGLSFGAGSGWTGVSDTAVDNVTFGFSGVSTSYNFEVVPEPSSLSMAFLLFGLLFSRRSR